MDKDEYKDRIKKQIEVMEACLEGKDIQVSYGDGIWEDTEHPEWTWDVIKYRVKPDEVEKPKKLMTCRQLSELLANGYGQHTYLYKDETTSFIYSSIIYSSFDYNKDNENKPLSDKERIRPWGSDEWLEPTVDVYEEFMNRKEKERRYQNIKISIKKLNGDDFEVESEPDEETIKDYSDCGSVEPKIGEVFRYNGLVLRCEEGDCTGCFGCDIDFPCATFKCGKASRKDGKGVHFVDISEKENTTASEESSATVSKEEMAGVHRRTPQEIADFFNCYVAMDKDGEWYLYSEEPRFGSYSWKSSKGLFRHMDSLGFLSFIIVTENHNWRTLYRPHQEPIVNEEEEDD